MSASIQTCGSVRLRIVSANFADAAGEVAKSQGLIFFAAKNAMASSPATRIGRDLWLGGEERVLELVFPPEEDDDAEEEEEEV